MIGPAGCDSCQNITSFRTPHNNFKTLPLPSKLQREKRKIKVVSNTRSIVVFRLTFLLLFFRGSFAGNRRRRIPAVSRFKLKSTKHRQQNAPCYVRLFFFRRKSFTFALRQEPITWSLQPLCIFVTAFSQTRLFLVWIYREVGLTRAHRLIKIRAWLISNFTRQYIEEKQQRDAMLLAIVRVQIHVNEGVPSWCLRLISWKRRMLCDSVLTYGRNR